jgi:hypothetical protein
VSQWFGGSGWCPATDVWEHVAVPVGERCVCGELIGEGDEGFVFPNIPAEFTVWHRRCWEAQTPAPPAR